MAESLLSPGLYWCVLLRIYLQRVGMLQMSVLRTDRLTVLEIIWVLIGPSHSYGPKGGACQLLQTGYKPVKPAGCQFENVRNQTQLYIPYIEKLHTVKKNMYYKKYII